MTEATKRPWNRGENGRDTFGIYAANGKRIAEVLPRPADDDFGFPDEAIANAEFIVKAVNNHDALVAALEAAIPMLTHATRTTNGTSRARLAAEAALEQVK